MFPKSFVWITDITIMKWTVTVCVLIIPAPIPSHNHNSLYNCKSLRGSY